MGEWVSGLGDDVLEHRRVAEICRSEARKPKQLGLNVVTHWQWQDRVRVLQLHREVEQLLCATHADGEMIQHGDD